MRSCSAGVNQRFQTNTATKPATIRATAANRKYSVGVTVYLDELAPSSTRPQGSLLSNCPGAVLAPVRDTWRQRMLADNQANCDKFHKKVALNTTGIERGMVDQAGVITAPAEHLRPSGAKGL